jgi:hypothetical protein
MPTASPAHEPPPHGTPLSWSLFNGGLLFVMPRRLLVVIGIVLSYWGGLLVIEHLPAIFGVVILFLIPTIGFFAVIWAFEPESKHQAFAPHRQHRT